MQTFWQIFSQKSARKGRFLPCKRKRKKIGKTGEKAKIIEEKFGIFRKSSYLCSVKGEAK